MGEVKIFRIEGEIIKPNWQTKFTKEIRALKSEDAIESIYKEIGSKHKVKRFQMRILKVEEIKPEEAKSAIIRDLSMGEV